jgi:putative colanic acid biosynthesis glycosyltransferase WcaI
MIDGPDHILLISPFIYPEPISTGKYNTCLTKALVSKGCSVEVIAFHPIYPDWKAKWTEATLEGVTIQRGGGWLRFPKSIVLRRILLEVGFFLHTLRHLLFRRNWEIIVPVLPPSLLFFLISPLFPQSAKKIGIVHDILGVMAIVSKSPFRKTMMQVIRFLEKRSFTVCDKLIFVSKSMANRAINDYQLDPAKISVKLPFATIEKQDLKDELSPLFHVGFKHIVYSGAIGEKQNPFALLELYKAIVKKREDVCCHFFSRGPLYEKLMKAGPNTSKRILFHDLVPEENLYELYLQSHIQILPQKEGTSEGAIPSKLPNLISAGVPIFGISDPGSELSEIIRESGIGYCADSWAIDALVAQLDDFISNCSLKSHEERQMIVKPFVKEHFGIDRLVRGILEWD